MHGRQIVTKRMQKRIKTANIDQCIEDAIIVFIIIAFLRFLRKKERDA